MDVVAPGRDSYEKGDNADSPAAGDLAMDIAGADVRGGVSCPATINGSLDSSDLTQVGRHSRIAPSSTCGSMKTYPGNSADSTYAHLYDVHHFSNPGPVPVCFNFTLTYFGAALYAAAYSSFEPTNLAAGYLGDVGGVLTSPQTMGITVGAGASLDVVVYATAMGTVAAGPYTLSCSEY